jgi:hypothetical protein
MRDIKGSIKDIMERYINFRAHVIAIGHDFKFLKTLIENAASINQLCSCEGIDYYVSELAEIKQQQTQKKKPFPPPQQQQSFIKFYS